MILLALAETIKIYINQLILLKNYQVNCMISIEVYKVHKTLERARAGVELCGNAGGMDKGVCNIV